MSAFAPGALIGDHAAPGDRLEGDLADELRRRPGHEGDDLVVALLQLARDLDGLVGADSAGDAEGYQRHGFVQSVPSGAFSTLPSRTSALASLTIFAAARRPRRHPAQLAWRARRPP